MSWVRFLVRVVFVARKLITIEERRPTKVVCFNEEITGQRPYPRKSVLGSNPDEDVFCSSVSKHNRRTGPRADLLFSAGRLQE
jgi:hypothetical protein